MRMICTTEGAQIDIKSLGLIAREAAGSARDALSLLDQVMTCSEETMTHEQILNILGVIDRKTLFDISEAILHQDIPELLDILDASYDRGYDMKKLYANLVEHFRNLLVIKMGKKITKIVDLIDKYIETDPSIHVMVHYSVRPEDGEELKDMISVRYNCAEVYLTPYSPVMVSATGPMVGVSFYS